MKHSGRSKLSRNIICWWKWYDLSKVWVGSALNTSSPCQNDWFVDIMLNQISSQRMIPVKIVLFGFDHDTYNLRSIWFDLFIKRLIQGPGKSERWEWRQGSVSTKGPVLFFSSNLKFCISWVSDHHHVGPSHLNEGFQMIS